MPKDSYHGDEGQGRTDPLYALRHSAAHIMAHAVQNLWPDTKFAIGPPVEDGFYYDLELEHTITPDDLEKIEKEMARIAKEDPPFTHETWESGKAREHFDSTGQDYKVELIDDIGEPEVSIYRVGEFTDLCAGPHIDTAGQTLHAKLLSIAGAYWRGSEQNQMLQRIYGTVWPSAEELDAYLERLEEAKKRDHRKLGKELDLFQIEFETAGPGLVFWHPKGTVVRHLLEEYSKELHLKYGYQYVATPHIYRRGVFQTSGHYDYYRENMFTMTVGEEDEYVLKPMNCPGHVMIYRSRLRSYRELPLRLAELGHVYRYERSGTLHGLMRVRGLLMDDAHIFCMPGQVESEIVSVLEMIQELLGHFGFEEWRAELSVRDPAHPGDYAGEPEMWDHAEAALVSAARQKGLEPVRMEGEAVFYGPKIDIKIVDAIGRPWQLSTVQFDFNLPGRFGLTYMGDDGREHSPYMVHRAIYGSIERFAGILIEHYAGAFPPWLAPEQVRILSITNHQEEYVLGVRDRLREAGLRAEADVGSEKVGKKVAEAVTSKIPWILVCGKREAEAGTVSVRTYADGDQGVSELEAFLEGALAAVRERRLTTS